MSTCTSELNIHTHIHTVCFQYTGLCMHKFMGTFAVNCLSVCESDRLYEYTCLTRNQLNCLADNTNPTSTHQLNHSLNYTLFQLLLLLLLLLEVLLVPPKVPLGCLVGLKNRIYRKHQQVLCIYLTQSNANAGIHTNKLIQIRYVYIHTNIHAYVYKFI